MALTAHPPQKDEPPASLSVRGKQSAIVPASPVPPKIAARPAFLDDTPAASALSQPTEKLSFKEAATTPIAALSEAGERRWHIGPLLWFAFALMLAFFLWPRPKDNLAPLPQGAALPLPAETKTSLPGFMPTAAKPVPPATETAPESQGQSFILPKPDVASHIVTMSRDKEESVPAKTQRQELLSIIRQ